MFHNTRPLQDWVEATWLLTNPSNSQETEILSMIIRNKHKELHGCEAYYINKSKSSSSECSMAPSSCSICLAKVQLLVKERFVTPPQKLQWLQKRTLDSSRTLREKYRIVTTIDLFKCAFCWTFLLLICLAKVQLLIEERLVICFQKNSNGFKNELTTVSEFRVEKHRIET